MKKFIILSLTIATGIFNVQNLSAQDGEQLFKAKCNTCHMVDKNSTGPILKGVKQKWTDAGEGEMLYDWVKNPQNLIASGKSQMAGAIKGFSGSDMTPQVVSNEEIDAILSYVDNYTAPTATETTATHGDPAVVKVIPDYNANLTLFYWLIVSIIVLLIGIIVLSSSISNLIKSDYFKKKIVERNSNFPPNLIAIIAFLGLMFYSNHSNALTFMNAGEAEKGTPWLLVENIDLYVMVTINIILLFVVLYLRRMFNTFLAMVRPEKQVSTKRSENKINKILTDAVAIEEEHTILMQHEYDGIRELDNNLPPWWVWGFYATIVFAVVYIFNYHVFKTGDLQIKEYDKEIAQAKKDVDAYLSKMAMNVDETNATLLTDAGDISSGKALFESNCVVCHNPNGEGNIGPNLTDNYWVYGPDVKDLFGTIKKGTPNGMPEHLSKLNPIQIQQVSSFVLSLPETKGKAPDGKEYKDDGKLK